MAPFNITLPEVVFEPAVFENTEAILRMHLSTPRATQIRNFTVMLFPSTNDQALRGLQRDYLVGLALPCLLVLTVLLVWAIVLLVLKCMGRRVGCASGAPFRYPHAPGRGHDSKKNKVDILALPNERTGRTPLDGENHEEDITEIDGCIPTNPSESDLKHVSPPNDIDATCSKEGALTTRPEQLIVESSDQNLASERLYEPLDKMNWRIEADRVARVAGRTRWAFLISGLLVVVCSILFLVFGVDSLAESVKAVQTGIKLTETVIESSLLVTENFIESAETARNLSTVFLDNIDESWCPNLANVSYDQEIPFRTSAGDVVDALHDMGDFVLQEAINLYNDLNTTLFILHEVREATEYAYWAFFAAAGFTVSFNLLVIWLMFGVFEIWMNNGRNVFKCFRYSRTFIVMPILVVMVILVWILSCLFFLLSMTSADFCIDSPDHNVAVILQKFEKYISSLIFELGIFYISGCNEELRPVMLGKVLMKSMALMGVVHKLLEEMLAFGTETLGAYCGADAIPLVAAAKLLDAAMHTYVELVIGVLAIFDCSSIHPVYSSIFYDAICYNGVTGLASSFVSLFFACIFSMVLVTLRVSWIETVEDHPAKKKRRLISNFQFTRVRQVAEKLFLPQVIMERKGSKHEINAKETSDTQDTPKQSWSLSPSSSSSPYCCSDIKHRNIEER